MDSLRVRPRWAATPFLCHSGETGLSASFQHSYLINDLRHAMPLKWNRGEINHESQGTHLTQVLLVISWRWEPILSFEIEEGHGITAFWGQTRAEDSPPP